MLIALNDDITAEQKQRLAAGIWRRLQQFETVEMNGKTVLDVHGIFPETFRGEFERMEGVEAVFAPDAPLVCNVEPTRFFDKFALIAGPCAVEPGDGLFQLAQELKAVGATALRGGAFKPRKSPYLFQGLGLDGLKILKEAGRAADLPVVSEITDTRDVELFNEYVDIIQVGARHMSNTPLLKELAKIGKPVILKRSPTATIEEFLLAAEYLFADGNTSVMLCERGIRTAEPATRNTLDVAAVPVLKTLTRLPVFVDASHGTGFAELTAPMSLAAAAAGADGVMLEVHENPPCAYSDAAQALTTDAFSRLIKQIAAVRAALEVSYE